MVYRILADLIALTHFAFIVFALLGGLLALRWRWVPWVHLPAVGWGVAVELFGWFCPLTPLENLLRRASGSAGYQGGFIDHYLMPIIYPANLTREVQLLLGCFLAALNVAIYLAVWRRLRTRANSGPGTYEFFLNEWPQLKPHLPDDLINYHQERFNGLVSHPENLGWKRILYPDVFGEPFPIEDLPDPFHLILSHCRGNFDCLVLMWRKGPRRFWVSDTYVVLMGDESSSKLVSGVSDRIDEALSRWDQGDEIVMYSEELGWYEPASETWKRRRQEAEALRAGLDRAD